MAFREKETVAQFELGSLRNFVYLILDWKTGVAAIIDPQEDVLTPLSAMARHGFQLERILLTHTHHDHIAGVPELLRRFPGMPVTVHSNDQNRLGPNIMKKAKIHSVTDGETVRVGSLEILAIHTPGHSPGEICYLLKGSPCTLFSGDTVFIRDCGRTDFLGGSNEEMFASLQRIKRLPPSTIIMPGHHYAPENSSTLERELLQSPPLRCQSVEELAALP